MAPAGFRLPIMAPVLRAARVGLTASNPAVGRFVSQSTPSTLRTLRPLAHQAGASVGYQRMLSSFTRPTTTSLMVNGNRTYGTVQGVPRNQLANAEANANKDPSNANLQNAFYNLLLRANLPNIVITRHQTGRFGANASTQEIYNKALNAVQGGVSTATGSQGSAFQANVTEGSGIAEGGRGEKGKPVYVIMEESLGIHVFRWVKFVAFFALFTWLCFSAITFFIEFLVPFRRPGQGPKTDSEVTSEKQTVRFTDVHGCNEAKDELQEVVEFLRSPDKFSDLGAKLPKGVLLVGPPGTGKTLLARAVAGEAGVPFFYMSGSEFDEVFVGVGAKRVRDLFNSAKSKSPAIIFIDELDAIGGKRNPRDQAHSKQTLNQLLTELDGFDQDTKIIIIAATNTPKMLDKALTRPGRFDRHVNVSLPDVRGRIEILKHHAKKIKLASDVDLEAIASRSPGRSGAELENMLNVAALRASRARASFVSSQDMDWAFDRVTMGAEHKSRVITLKEKEMTAYHEAGHALVQLFDKDSSNTLYKVTILPKGPSLGHTAFTPQMDKYSTTAAEYMSSIRVALGGKMAEELQYGNNKVTSGVSADLESATNLCFAMTTMFGMSDDLGPVEYNKRYEHLSTETRAKIEAEVQKMLKASYADVRAMLTDKRKELDLLAQALVKYETLDRKEVERVIRGEDLPEKKSVPPGPMVMPIPADESQSPPIGGRPEPVPDSHGAPPSATGRTSEGI